MRSGTASSSQSAPSPGRRRTRSMRAGMFVAPGFINIHSHASPDALATALNMLTQGVTTEIFNADGGGRGRSRRADDAGVGAGTRGEPRRLHRVQRDLADGGRQRRSPTDTRRDRTDAIDDHRGPRSGRVGRVGGPRLQAGLLRAHRGSDQGRRRREVVRAPTSPTTIASRRNRISARRSASPRRWRSARRPGSCRSSRT